MDFNRTETKPGFEEVTPQLFRIKESSPNVRITENRLFIGKGAWEELGQPGSIKIEIDVATHVLRLTDGGPYTLAERRRTITARQLEAMPGGLYLPTGGGLYKWAVDEQ